MALFFCLPMAFQSSDRTFFLSGFLWVLTNLYNITLPPTHTDKEDHDVPA